VSVGAILSTVDAATDIYVIAAYYQSPELVNKANVLLAMIILNIFNQLLVAYNQYKKKSWTVLIKEVLTTLFFLHPAVDAYRISTNHKDDDTLIDPLAELVLNKACDLAWESIPGAVLQIYVFLINRDEAGSYALESITVSALTTGYTSAQIAFDVEGERRKNQPKLYGYIPDDNAARGRCFMLMALISTIHNASRSFWCALLAVKSGKLVVYFIGGEMAIFFLFKLLRKDFYYGTRL